MKSLTLFWMPGLMVLMVFLGVGAAAAQPGPRVSFQTFYDELDPYGHWREHPRYGYVWVPDAGPDFQPYATDGHWVVTEYGNTWVSDYAWGWAPFHYGRWFYDDFYGWTWVPGQEWGPAWVSWRNGGGYYGWAPLGPGMEISHYDIPVNYWCFVPEIHIVRPRIITYCVPRPRVVYIFRHTRHLNNVYHYRNRAYVYGPRREDIERVTRRRVDVYRVDHGDRPGRTQMQDRTVRIYRPDVEQNQQERSRPRQLAIQDPSGQQRGTITGRNASGSERYRIDRSAEKNDDPIPGSRESSYRQEHRDNNSGYQPSRTYPGRSGQAQEPVQRNDNYRYGERTRPANGRERVETGSQAAREMAGPRVNQREYPSAAPARERVSRGSIFSQPQPSRESGGYSGGYRSRSGEAGNQAPGMSPAPPQRDQQAAPSRNAPGRSRRE